MNISKVIRFLVTGVVIGAILFFAGFGILNLFQKDREITTTIETPATEVQVASEGRAIDPPKIEVTSNQVPDGTEASAQATNESSAQTNNVVEGEGTSRSPIKIKPLNSEDSEAASGGTEETPAIAFGTLKLNTINSINNQPTNADFLIENSDNVAIARVKDTSTSTVSLPVGDYKITVSQGSQKVIRFLGVKENQNGSETFELYVPTLEGETATVAEVGSDQPQAPVVVKPATTPEAKQPTTEAVVTTTQTAEPSTEVTVSPPVNPETPVVVEPESSTTTLSFPGEPLDSTTQAATTSPEGVQVPASTGSSTSSQNTRSMGGLKLSALTKKGKRPTTASFYIQRLSGQNVKTFSNIKTRQTTLPAGKYRVVAKSANATVVKEIEVLATKGVHEIFLIPEPPKTSTPKNTQRQASAPPKSSQGTTQSSGKKETGKLELFAQDASNSSPIKSNFYVQMPNGTMVASKVYADSIGYKLPIGQYKVIVRAKGYKDKSVLLRVRKGQTRREVFKLGALNQAPSNTTSNTSIRPPAPVTKAPASPIVSPVQRPALAYGGLTVNIVAASTGAGIPADIVITQRDGTPLKQAMGVASASFDLPPREFLIRVTHDGSTTSHQVTIMAGKLAIKTISFDTQGLSRRERRQQRRERRERAQ